MPYIIKADGSNEPFSEEKVKISIIRAGIPEELQKKVLEHVKSKLYEGMKTSEIYHHIIEFLTNSTHPYTSTKYSLKQSIMDLGPTGYPFEDFVAKMFQEQEFTTAVRQIVMGKCISHEIDVIAQKNEEKIMIEVKFHNSPGTRTDSQNALYTRARFEDVKEKNKFSTVMLITNTKATTDAIVYGSCSGMKVIGWSYPDGESVRDLVEKAYLIPITALKSLSQSHKQNLLENHIVLCKQICSHPETLNTLDISEPKKREVLAEAEFVCRK